MVRGLAAATAATSWSWLSGQREAGQIASLAGGLVDEDNRNSGSLGQRRGGSQVGSVVEFHLGVGGFGPNCLQRGGREPHRGAAIGAGPGAGSVDLRRTAAGEHACIRVRADQRDRFDGRGIQRKQVARVLQQYRSRLGDGLRGVGAAKRIDHAAARRIVHDAGGEFRPHNAVHHVVQARERNFATIDRLLEGVAEVTAIGLLVVEAGQCRFDGAVGGAPIRDHETFEPPRLLQNVGQQITVLTGPIAIQLVVGAHHHAGLAFGNGDFEGQQVRLAHGAPPEFHIADAAAGLLVVEGVVLDVADDLVGLQALDELGHHFAGEDGIFSLVLEVAAVARFAGDVHAAAQRGVVLLIAELAANQVAVLVGHFQIPGGGFGHRRWQQGGVPSALRGRPDAHRGVGQLDIGEPQPGDAGDHAGPAVGARPGGSESAGAVHQRDLFFEGHLLHDHVGPLVRREARIHPRTFGGLCLSLRGQR